MQPKHFIQGSTIHYSRLYKRQARVMHRNGYFRPSRRMLSGKFIFTQVLGVHKCSVGAYAAQTVAWNLRTGSACAELEPLHGIRTPLKRVKLIRRRGKLFRAVAGYLRGELHHISRKRRATIPPSLFAPTTRAAVSRRSTSPSRIAWLPVALVMQGARSCRTLA